MTDAQEVPEGWPYRWTPEEIAAAQQRQRDEQPALLVLVAALRNADRHPELVWRCPTARRCKLFEVWRSPAGGFVVHRGRQPTRTSEVMRKMSHTGRGGPIAVDLDVLEVASRGGLVSSLAACEHLEVEVVVGEVRADLAEGRRVRAVDHKVGHMGAVMGPLTARLDDEHGADTPG